jgi:dephospho-CoA kinase
LAERAARWIVTGPAGAGKSTVTRLLAERGAVTVDGDRLGHALLREPAVVAAVGAAFGADVLRDGEVDRPALGRRVFADAAELERLDAIMLPRLAPRMREALEAAAREAAARPAPRLAVLEAAVYFLLPEPPAADLVVAVTAAPELRLRRLVEAGGLPAEEALRRIAAQRPLQPHWRRADVELVNEGDLVGLAAAAERLLGERLPR